MFPGLNVKVEITNEEIQIQNWESQTKHFYINQWPDKFAVTVTDSDGTKTYHFWKNYR